MITRQAIRTRYHGPTNTKGSRYTAAYAGGRVTLGMDYALNAEQNHLRAAEHLAAELGWGTVTAGGQFGHDYYWITTK